MVFNGVTVVSLTEEDVVAVSPISNVEEIFDVAVIGGDAVEGSLLAEEVTVAEDETD